MELELKSRRHEVNNTTRTPTMHLRSGARRRLPLAQAARSLLPAGRVRCASGPDVAAGEPVFP